MYIDTYVGHQLQCSSAVHCFPRAHSLRAALPLSSRRHLSHAKGPQLSRVSLLYIIIVILKVLSCLTNGSCLWNACDERLMQVLAALGPQEVVQECLTALRKADIERCAARPDVRANLPDSPSLVLTLQLWWTLIDFSHTHISCPFGWCTVAQTS